MVPEATSGGAVSAAQATRANLHGADVLAHFGDRHAIEQELQLLLDIPRREPHALQPLHVHGQMQHGRALIPFQVRLHRMGIVRHDRAHRMGDAPQFDRIRSEDAEAQRPDHRRAVQQP